jgi:hypothetical protein
MVPVVLRYDKAALHDGYDMLRLLGEERKRLSANCYGHA